MPIPFPSKETYIHIKYKKEGAFHCSTFLFYFPRNVPEPSGRSLLYFQSFRAVTKTGSPIRRTCCHVSCGTSLRRRSAQRACGPCRCRHCRPGCAPYRADEDVARFGNLTAEEFYSQSLTFRFATVLGTTDSFLMCHFSSFLVVKH